MELSLEEALDICLELLGCGAGIVILQMLLHTENMFTLFERII